MITKINELAKLGDAIAISKSEGSLVKDQTLYGFFSLHLSHIKLFSPATKQTIL